MADPTTAQSDPAGAGGSGWELELSMAYIKSIPGMLKIVEFVCILYYLQNKRPPPPPDEYVFTISTGSYKKCSW